MEFTGGYPGPMYYPDWTPEPDVHVTISQYRRHPYVRATLPDGTTRDGTATAWTRDRVYFRWTNHTGTDVRQLWMDAEHVTRIKRSEADVPDPYDDLKWYLEQGW